jgi:ketosteroid isomerase-like protein
MSQENVEIVRRLYDAFSREDWDAAVRDVHPDSVVTFKGGPRAGTYPGGSEELRAVIEEVRAGFDSWITEPLEFFESGERVVAIVNNRLRPKGGISGEFEYRNGTIWTIRDGKIRSMVQFPNPEEALEAAGLRE